MKISFTLNGRQLCLEADPSRRLIDFLREDLGLTGTKEGCGEGECGSCTVIIDRGAVHACLTLVGQINGREVLTVEGLSVDGKLSSLQENFIRHGAVQCGYCAPGMLMSAKALLDENPNPSAEEIRLALAGNLCRCTGYNKLEEAVLASREGGAKQ